MLTMSSMRLYSLNYNIQKTLRVVLIQKWRWGMQMKLIKNYSNTMWQMQQPAKHSSTERDFTVHFVKNHSAPTVTSPAMSGLLTKVSPTVVNSARKSSAEVTIWHVTSSHSTRERGTTASCVRKPILTPATLGIISWEFTKGRGRGMTVEVVGRCSLLHIIWEIM